MTPTDTPAGWSERQLRTLAELFAAVVEPRYEGESRRHAELAATALTDVADPADLRQVRLTLTLLGSRTGSWLLAQRSSADREALLRAWSTSLLPQRRTFFQLLKRLASFFAYADPGPSGANPRWAGIGFGIPDEPVAETDHLAGALLPTDGAGVLELDADAVVVGSGAGGGVVAARLAEAGLDVLVVEAALYVAEAELPRNEVDGYERLYLDKGLATSADLSVSILAGAAVGGGTLVNWTTCIDPPEWIRQAWAGLGVDGFDGAGTDAHLARIHAELGFCAPPNFPAKDQLILDGAAALGWEAAPTARNAADCGDCGACSFGCRRGAKRSGQRLHLAMAAANGARLLAGAQVERVEIRAGAASGVSGRLVGSGRPFAVRAGAVVICAGALRTPTLLMKSGVSHPALGANLHLHPTAVVAARMAKPVEIWHGTTQAARSLELLRRGVIIESAPAHPGLIAVALPWRGRAEAAEQMKGVRNLAPLIGIVRDRDGGRVHLTRAGRTRVDYRISRRDAATARVGMLAMARLARAGGATRLVALGTPGLGIDLDGDERAFNRFLDRLAAFDFAPNRGTLFSAHQMGSARAGSNARETACDPYGRVRADTRGGTVGGLWVGDASLFPTAVGVNPMVTVMALASRVATAVAADWRPHR